MPFSAAATCALSPSAVSQRLTWTRVAGRLGSPVGLEPPAPGLCFVHRQAQLEALAQVWRGAGHVATSAATVVVVAPVPEGSRDDELDQFDMGQAVMAMAIAAADQGIGSGHASVGDQDKARAILGVPSDQYCAYLLALGYPADRPLAPLRHLNRRPFDQVVHRGHW